MPSGELPDGVLLERIIKPALSGIEGVGEVEIAGPGIREIVIILDQEKCAALGLSPAGIAGIMGSNDALFPGGLIRYGSLEVPVRIDGRYADLRDLGEALIPAPFGGVIRLKDIAQIREEQREAQTLSRLNGQRTAVISVIAASGADPGILSGKIKKEMEKFSSLPLEFHVLEDRGAEEAAAFRSVLAAALQASVLVALAAILLGWGKRSGLKNGIICAVAIPLILVISSAFLAALGFPVNRKFLAGLTVGIGGAVDAVILGAEGFGWARNPGEGKKILRGIWSPLVSGAATTIAALLPLMGITAASGLGSGVATGDITIITSALGIVTLVSVALALSLLPPLFLWDKRAFLSFPPVMPMPMLPVLIKKLHRQLNRYFAVLVRFCVKRPLVFPAISFFVSIAAIIALVLSGADTGGDLSGDSVYVQIEFEGGFLMEEGDRLLASWAMEIKKHPAITDVQTGARTGSGYALLTFDSRMTKADEIRTLVRSNMIPEAFFYIPEPSAGDRIWNITVSGDDADKCRELAKMAASLCYALPFIQETVLNFKDGGPRLTLLPKRQLLSQSGMSFSFPADTVRRGVHGPVAYKKIGDAGETDVRIRFETLSGEDVLRIPIAGMRIDSIMRAEKTPDVSGIRRENRRRVASFSIRTGPGDPRVFRDKTMTVLNDMELPAGYKIEFDPEAVRRAEALSLKFLNFIWAVLFCYMIIAAAEESFVLPLIVLSSIPPSLAVPLLIIVLSGVPVNASAACAMVAVSGLAVNASVISAGQLWRRDFRGPAALYRILMNRIPALLATTGTTIAGALPFLFLAEASNAFVRTLGLVTVLGVGASFFCSITLVP